MHEYLIDLRLVKDVWHHIETYDDARLREKRQNLFMRCKSLLDKSFNDEAIPLDSTAVDHATLLSQRQLAEESLQVVRDVLSFVRGALDFYDTVDSYRSLTKEEKQIGNTLAILTKQVQALVPGTRLPPM